MQRWIDDAMDQWINGSMDGWWMDGWMDGWMDRCTLFCIKALHVGRNHMFILVLESLRCKVLYESVDPHPGQRTAGARQYLPRLPLRYLVPAGDIMVTNSYGSKLTTQQEWSYDFYYSLLFMTIITSSQVLKCIDPYKVRHTQSLN